MSALYEIGDIVEDVNWGRCEIIKEGNYIQGVKAYLGIPLEDKNLKYQMFCLLEKDLKLIK